MDKLDYSLIAEPSRTIPVVASPDVCVIGSGPAGIGAAIAAARTGAKTMIVERYGFVGGNLTIAMVSPMFTFHDIHGRQVIQGIAGEFANRLVQQGSSFGHVTDLTFDNPAMMPYDPEGTKVLLFEMLEEAGVDILLHAMVTGVQREGRNIKAVIIESKSGRQAICPKYIIDCSADADVIKRAGGKTVKGRESDGIMQPATLYFRIGNVNNDNLRNWMKQNRALLKDSPTDEEIDQQRLIAFLGMNDLVKKAMENGELDSEVAPRILMYQLPLPGQFSVNSTRLQGIDGTNVRDLTRAEIALRKQAKQVHRFLKKYVGGFEDSIIIDSGVQVGIRETRRIIGEYTMTEEDVLNSTAFFDGISCGTFAIDVHPPEGGQQIFTGSGKAVYEIPYRSTIPKEFNNVLVAGRCISATHTAVGSTRVMATCMGIGQGAGTAMALALKKNLNVREVDTKLLRKTLIDQGQYLLNENIDEKIDQSLVLNRGDSDGKKASHFNPFKSKS
tara:strand:+ start:5283 stop:6785 length:1503 start_codon:yes stop_codon:yes gene_type:complete